MRRNLFCLPALLLLAAPAPAANLKVLPGDITLTGPHGHQKLLVVRADGQRVLADLTAGARFSTSDPKVVRIADGEVQAVGDGSATLSASVEGATATAKVTVRDTRAPFNWSFRNHVLPVLTRAGCNSGACHGALAGKGGLKLSLRGYDPQADHFVLTRQALGRRIDRARPARSLMLLKPTTALTHGGGRRLEVGQPDFRLLLDWIASGAPGPLEDDPRVERIEVLPARATLKPGDNLQVLVRAWYTDGSSQDVTRWAKFSSSEDLVAAVNKDGVASVAGHGEAAITVWYSNHVAANRITSPLPNKVDAKVFETAARNNYIDELVLEKLQELRIPPSPPCSDETFIRRVYLDAAGILPTPGEVRKFLADKRPDKRARLVEELLQYPEFVDYWAYKWSDLLLITTNKLPQSGVWSFYQFVRQSVADNKPWDRFAREIVLARGSTLRNGAANYYVMHKDVTDLTESTAVTFLGMSVTCCRCHNHPLEKWTQNQYWSLANLFSRVSLKDGEGGAVIVQEQPAGDVPHPRLGTPMPPAPLDAKPLSLDSAADRRKYFADWLTSPDNPYFARALVNRVWKNFLGRGLVEAEDDLRATNPPSNPELLDALAKDFIAHKYDVKHLMRTILLSATYQRSAATVPGNEKDDRFYSRYLIRRLPAEVILDAYSQVTGVPTPFTQLNSRARDSVTNYAGFPRGTRALQLPDAQVVSPFLDAFGRPERAQTCSCERMSDASVGQALHVNNGKTLNDKLRAKDSRVSAWLADGVSDEQAVERLYLRALSRAPTVAERKRILVLMAEARAEKAPRREVLEDLFWGVLTSREFLFNQ